ncbi:MAG: hypothetical protein WC977_04445 [Anaerovoracaceae bacterium]
MTRAPDVGAAVTVGRVNAAVEVCCLFELRVDAEEPTDATGRPPVFDGLLLVRLLLSVCHVASSSLPPE